MPLLKNNSLKIKKTYENNNNSTNNNSNILIKEKSYSLYNIHDSNINLNKSNKLPIILYSKKTSKKLLNENFLLTNSKNEYSPKFYTNNNESPNKLSPIKNYKKIININTYNNSNKIKSFKNKRNFTYNFKLNNFNNNNNNNNRYNFNLNNLEFDFSKNNFFTIINNNNNNTNESSIDLLNSKKFFSNKKISLISKSNNNLFTVENKNNKSTIINKKSEEKNSFSFNKTNKNDLISKLKSFNQKITIKILSKYNKNEIFKIENLKFFNNKEKEIFYLFCYLNNKLIDKIKNSEIKFEKKNIFDFYFKLTDKIKYIKIKNSKNNFGIKEIEIFHNKNLIFKGNIPNNNNEYKIYIKNSNKNSNINIQKINTKNKNNLNYNLIKTLSLLNSKKKSKNNSLNIKNNKNYIKCNKIKIILVSNYGNKNLIGLTGIQFIIKNNNNNNNNNNKIENFCYFDIIKNNSILNINPKNDSFINLFTKNNLTTDENCMYETLNLNPSIEIIFNKIIYLHEIKFYNFNQPKNLDKCTKKLNIYFNEEKLPFEFYLHKGIGKNSIDFSQSFFPSNNSKQKIFLSEFELEPFKQIKHASLLYNQNYETPYLPSGFIFQFIFFDNWGDQNYIAFDDIKLFDQFGKEIKYNKCSHSKYMKFYNFRKQNYIKKINEFFIIFDNVVIISYIKIFNYKEDINKGIRRIIIKLDQNIIFEGYVNKYNANLNGTTCILFTCDLYVTKHIQENELPGFSENIEYLKNLQNRKEIKTKKGRILKLV